MSSCPFSLGAPRLVGRVRCPHPLTCREPSVSIWRMRESAHFPGFQKEAALSYLDLDYDLWNGKRNPEFVTLGDRKGKHTGNSGASGRLAQSRAVLQP